MHGTSDPPLAGPERLRDWISRSKLNQRQAAKILGVDPVVLSQWLNRQRTPGLANAVSIEQATGVSVESWLLSDVNSNGTATVTNVSQAEK